MAYLIGLVTPAEAEVLKMRGWDLEDPPAPDYFTAEDQSDIPDEEKAQYVMVWVDTNLFEIMSEPTWETNCLQCGMPAPESSYKGYNKPPEVEGSWHKESCKFYRCKGHKEE